MEKILVVITTGFDSVGGITSAAMNYIRNIEKNSISFDFCSFNEPNGELLSEITEYGYNYYKLPDRRKKIIQYCQQLSILLKKNRYNIIHIHGNSSTMVFELLVAKIAKVEKRIVHGHAKSTNYPLANKILSPLFNSLYTDAIAVSNESGKWLYKKRFTVINNAIDVNKYKFNIDKRNVIRNKLKIDEDCIVVGNVSKLNEGKNLFFLIDIYAEYFKMNSNSRLLIVGGGMLYDKLKQYVLSKNLQDNIILTGMKMNVNDYLSAMDCFVFTSLYEGLGMVLIEAQAAGLPCICSNRVPVETKVTQNIEYVDIDEPVSKWALKINNIEKTDRKSEDIYNDIKKNGYDINTETNKLYDIYLKY